MNAEIDPELMKTLQEIQETLPLIIEKLRIEIGRMPTQEEVEKFFWAENDEVRVAIIRKARENA